MIVARSWPDASGPLLLGLVRARGSSASSRLATRRLRAVEQRAVVALDHPHGRAHDPRELEHADAGGERVRGERRAQVVDPRRLRRTPDASIAGAHSRRRKLSRLSSPPRGAGNRSGVSSRGGSASSAASARRESGTWRRLRARLAELDDLAVETVRRTLRTPRGAVDVAALERLPLLGPQPGRGGERRQRPVRRRQLGGDRVELGERVGAHRPRRRLRVAARRASPGCGSCSPSGRRRRASAGAPARSRSASARAAWPASRRARRSCARGRAAARRRRRRVRVREPLAQRRDRARPDAGGVALEVELDELGERQLGRGAGSPRSCGSITSR